MLFIEKKKQNGKLLAHKQETDQYISTGWKMNIWLWSTLEKHNK